MPWEGPRPTPRFLSREDLRALYAVALAADTDAVWRDMANTRLQVLKRYPIDTIPDDSILAGENPL